MTVLLKKAFRKAGNLPEYLQDELAKELLDELTWEKRWSESLSISEPKLNSLAEKALKDFAEGKTEEKDLDQL